MITTPYGSGISHLVDSDGHGTDMASVAVRRYHGVVKKAQVKKVKFVDGSHILLWAVMKAMSWAVKDARVREPGTSVSSVSWGM